MFGGGGWALGSHLFFLPPFRQQNYEQNLVLGVVKDRTESDVSVLLEKGVRAGGGWEKWRGWGRFHPRGGRPSCGPTPRSII
jgi:hypothetical protein